MKVGTDGVLLGAWGRFPGKGSILDLGTGTGLIALICAQRTINSDITGIELDSDAAAQANENFGASKWSDRLSVVQGDARIWAKSQPRRFDHIVSNPPFFKSNSIPNALSREKARNQSFLGIDVIFSIAKRVGVSNHRLSIILPYQQKADLLSTASQFNYFLTRLCEVRPNSTKKAHRVMAEFCTEVESTENSELVLEVERHVKAAEYQMLTRELYL